MLGKTAEKQNIIINDKTVKLVSNIKYLGHNHHNT